MSIDFYALQKSKAEWADPLFPGCNLDPQSANGPALPVISARQSRTVSSPDRSSKTARVNRQWSAKVPTDELYPQSPSRQLRQRNGLGSGELSTGSHGMQSPVQNSVDMTPPGPAAPVPPSETTRVESPIRVFQRSEQDSDYPVDTSQILRMQEYNASRPVSRRPKTVSVVEDFSKPLIIPQKTLWPELENLPNESALEPKPAKRVQSSRSSRRQASEARHVRGPGLRAATAISARPRRGPDDAFGLTARTVYNARTWTPSMTFPIGGRS